MEKFSEFKIKFDFNEFEKNVNIILKKLENEKEKLTFFNLIKDYFNQINNYDSFENIYGIKFAQDVTNLEYEKKNNLVDKYKGKVDLIKSHFYKIILKSEFREDIEEKYGLQILNLAKCKIDSTNKNVEKLIEEENTIISEYQKLISTIKIKIEDKEYPMSRISKLLLSKNREERKKIYFEFDIQMKKYGERIDEIYDKLVKVRDNIAKELGFSNFNEVAYLRLNRTDYNSDDLDEFKEVISKKVKAKLEEIKKRKEVYFGHELMPYDTLDFKDSEPEIKSENIINTNKENFEAFSSLTKTFINDLVKYELFDFEIRDNKRPGGFCTYLKDYEAPFIYGNTNGVPRDVSTLTHECGHALQMYMSKNKDFPVEYAYPTLEACEIHSMSMELFMHDYMDNFFGEDKNKFIISNFLDIISVLSACSVNDEFQKQVYSNPQIDSKKRRELYKEVRLRYFPEPKQIDNLKYLDKGVAWHRVGHLFYYPHYYIDYALAQICALQFYKRYKENREDALKDYFEICRVGGSKSFFEILEIGNLKNPLDPKVLEETIDFLFEEFENLCENFDYI